MRISVYNIYVLAWLMGALAATLSGIVLTNAFNAQQAASELAQQNLGEGQVRAIIMSITHQMNVIRSNSEANARQVAMWAAQMPARAVEPDHLVEFFNQSVYESWSPRIRANYSLNGYALTFMYPKNSSKLTYAKAFGMWKDISRDGEVDYVYAYPSNKSNLSDVYKNVWTDFATPTLTDYLYSYNPYVLNAVNYPHDDYFPAPVPWSTKDGNAYWTLAHQRLLVLHGVTVVVQSWDVGVDWRDRMENVCTKGSEMLVIDNSDMVLAATTEAEVQRMDECRAGYVDGVVQAACLEIPAAQYPVPEIRDLRNALYEPLWSDVNAPPMPITYHQITLHGQSYRVLVATLFSSGNFRATVLWYQPWVEPQTNVTILVAIICILTVVSTLVLALLGIFGILRPLIRLGRSMRTVADNLKYGDGGGGAKALVQRRSLFTEVYAIQMDFETIVMDFLGFSSTRKASEQADTVLNHILKNTMADATACIQLYAEGKAAHVAPDLAQAVTCLARGMQWCRKRHVLMRMAQGDYLPALHPVSLREFGEQLVRGRAVTSSFPSEVVLLDEVLCDILLDNALNNAFRHGDPTDPQVQFCMDLVPVPEVAGGGAGPPARQLTFFISNRADPTKPPVTPELVDGLLSGRLTSDRGLVYRSALSEHLGLHHMFKVAETHGMSLTLHQMKDTVLLRARLKVHLAKEPSLPERRDPSLDSDDPQLPTGLRLWALDDSPIARRLLQHSIPKHFPGSTMHVMGDTPDHVAKFITGAAEGADIIILDQHLDYNSESFLGTSVLSNLLDLGCRAFICMRSAAVVHGSDAAFRAAGAHCALGKDLRPEDFFNTLKRRYKHFLANPPPVVLSIPPGSPFSPGDSRASVAVPGSPDDRRHFGLVLPSALPPMPPSPCISEIPMPDNP